MRRALSSDAKGSPASSSSRSLRVDPTQSPRRGGDLRDLDRYANVSVQNELRMERVIGFELRHSAWEAVSCDPP